MAKQSGLIKLNGTLGGITFYKSQDGHLAREKGGVEASRIANDPNFQRTRENGAEFGSSASAGKLLRNTVRNLMMNASDNRVTSRLTQVMTQIKNYDATSVRGERNVGVGIADPLAVDTIKGFDFNDKATLGSVLFAPFTVDIGSGKIDFPAFTPVNDIFYPSGATHISLKCAFANIDFATNISAIEYSPVQNLAIDGINTPFALSPAAVPTGTGTKLYFLTMEFFQEVNGVQYSLRNGSYNVLNIVEVA
jgi:hypothetical protein